MTIAAVVPALDEAARIGATLDALHAAGIDEIVVVDAMGGFPDQPLMEDLEMSRRLRRRGAMPTVEREVIVSGRRFMAHPWRATLCCLVFPPLYDLGVPPATLDRVWKSVVR
ncbi:MAG: hypothetical protein H0T79_20580 [Deltaproteobacteria bacterium]|nr:hypothetical protein [Deltaproteobacteria bacterium]